MGADSVAFRSEARSRHNPCCHQDPARETPQVINPHFYRNEST